MGKYNPKTGEYDTDSKLFEPSLIDNELENTIIKRMKEAYGKDNLKMLMNTVAYNSNTENNNYYFQSGGVKDNELPYQTYERIKGKPWSTARQEGLTDGSAEQNLALQKQLLSQNISNDDAVNTTDEIEVPVRKKGKLSIGDITSEFIDDNNNALRNYVTIDKANGEKQRIKNPNFKSLSDLLNAANNNSFTPIPPSKLNQTVTKDNPIKKDDGDYLKTFKDTLQNIIKEGSGKINELEDNISDYAQMARNYVERHYMDEGVKTKNKITNIPNQYQVSKQEDNVFKENQEDIKLHEENNFVRGIFNLDNHKFASRNRGDLRPVDKGNSILITTFKPFEDEIVGGYDNYLYIDKNGKVDILNKNEIKNKKGKFSPINKLPLEKLQFSKDNKKVRLDNSPDMNNKVLYLGNINNPEYNSGIGVGKDFGDWANVKDLNNFSFLNGGKVLIKVNNEKYIVSGSAKDIIDAYQIAKQKGNVEVYKLDNGSYNLPMRGRNKGIIDLQDLKNHQNRNNAGGNSLVLIDN